MNESQQGPAVEIERRYTVGSKRPKVHRCGRERVELAKDEAVREEILHTRPDQRSVNSRARRGIHLVDVSSEREDTVRVGDEVEATGTSTLCGRAPDVSRDERRSEGASA